MSRPFHRSASSEFDLEAEKQLRRCIKSYTDTSIPIDEWERMYPKDVRNRAKHSMTLQQLRARDA